MYIHCWADITSYSSITFHQHGCLVSVKVSDPLASNTCFCFVCFRSFCISPSAYFCHIVKLLIKKETTRSFPTVFFLLSLPVSVGLITTNYNQQPLSSLLKSKCQKDKPRGFLWVIKHHGPSRAPLALVSKRPNSYTSIAVLRGEKSPLSSKVSLGHNGREIPPSDQGQGASMDSVWQPVSSQPAIPTSASHPREERSRWGDADKVDKSAGWMFSGSLISRQRQTLTELCSFCSWSLLLCIFKCQLWSSHPEVQLSFHPVTFFMTPIKVSSPPQMVHMVKMKTEMPTLCFACG